MFQGMVEAIGRGAAQAQQQPQQPMAAPADDDYVTAGHLKQAQAAAVAQLSPYLATVAEQQATMSYSIARERNADVFKKYEPEIVQVLGRIPRNNWTLDAIQNAVTFVKGNHVDEIVANKVRDLESAAFSTMRSTGRAGSGSDFQAKDTIAGSLEKTPEDWRAHARAVNITDRDVIEFCNANDTTPEEFFKQFEKGIVTDAVADVNLIRSRLG